MKRLEIEPKTKKIEGKETIIELDDDKFLLIDAIRELSDELRKTRLNR